MKEIFDIVMMTIVVILGIEAVVFFAVMFYKSIKDKDD